MMGKNDQLTSLYSSLLEQAIVQKTLNFIKKDHEQTVEDQIDITEIPAQTLQEHRRAEDYLQRIKELQLENVTRDDEGNVYGIRKGSKDGTTIFVSAHLDTVFPEGTDTTVKEKNGVLYAPG